MNNPRTIKKEIETVENLINDPNPDPSDKYENNLIILAGQRLQLGISLRNVDIVTLWNSTTSTDAIFQMLFRSMTEVDAKPCTTDTYCNQKKFGFMVDMNPERTLTNVTIFSDNIIKKTDNEIQTYRTITDLINIDEDVFNDKYDKTEEGRDKFIKDLFDKIYNSWNVNIDNIKKTIIKFVFDISKLQNIKEGLHKIVIHKQKKQKNNEFIGPGKSKEKNSSAKKSKKDKELDLNIYATEILSEFISLINIFTLYTEPNAKCILTDNLQKNKNITVINDINILKNKIYSNSEQKNIFLKVLNTRLTGNEKVAFSEEIIEQVLSSITVVDLHKINKIIMTKKNKYYTINEPDELLKEINNNLKPNKEEKDKNGEVFTPLDLVIEMLNNLDNSYKKQYSKSIFSIPSFKWLDPAVGIGQFTVILYKKLMEGLKLIIKNVKERQKHILENMIYMVEISNKSIYILNKIFCGNTYKLNIHTSSFLDGKCKYNFNFDVIMGNPPYNPPKTDSGSSGNSIWQHFVIKSYYLVKESGFLLFIHPRGWKKPTDEIFNPQKLDIFNGEYYKYDKTGKQTIKQIFQGQVLQVLKQNGNFSFIYTNDQQNKKIKEYIPFFPAVDYYVYQKNGDKTLCDTKNIFLGQIKESSSVKLNYKLNYLPILLSNQTLDILYNITTKEGNKPNFMIFRSNTTEFELTKLNKKYKYIYTFNSKSIPQYKYSNILSVNSIEVKKLFISSIIITLCSYIAA